MSIFSNDFLTTKETAKIIRRAPQTLRTWAMNENGPFLPVRTRRGAPLLWRRSDIEKFMSGEVKCEG